MADGLIVMVTERVKVSDTVMEPVTDTDLVAKAEAGTVYGAEGDLVTERVSVTETVGLIDRVNGQLVANTLGLPVTDLDIVREPVVLIVRVFGQLVAMGLWLRVNVTVVVRVGVIIAEAVIPDRVIVAVGQNVLVAICVVGIGVGVSVSDTVFVTLGVKDDVSELTDLVAYGVVGTGEGVIVMGDRVNVADGQIEIVTDCELVWLSEAVAETLAQKEFHDADCLAVIE